MYPPGPTRVPPGLIDASAAYKRNAWLAVLALFGFVAAYFGLTGWFAYMAYWFFANAHGFASIVAGIVAAFFAIFMVKALFFIRQHPDERRVEISAQEHPELFAFVQRLADEAKAPRPHRVFLSPDVNAAVFYDLSVVNLLIPSRKNLLIGLGLVNALNLGEFKAVLAHEFGHFAQRTMAVGRWVYIGQQIAGHIVAKRDALDEFLLAISRIDLRVAWVGWILRIIVWALRSLTETLFSVVVIAERALSREMELQADRVAVSLTGSDALVHALYKLHAADDAWTHVERIASAALNKDQRLPDVFAVQSRVQHHLERVLGSERYGDVPPVPALHPQAHRVFTPTLAQPPAMWSSHPPNLVREDWAKAIYVGAAIDTRPAWCLFRDPKAVRERMSEHLFDLADPARQANEVLTHDDALALADKPFNRAHLDPIYRGLYLGRQVSRACDATRDLYGAVPPSEEAIRVALSEAYPPSIAELIARAEELESEKHQLDAIAQGHARAAGGVVQYRGRTIDRRQLPGVIEQVDLDLAGVRRELGEVARRIRVAHWAAAKSLGGGWAEHLEGLLAVVHFAEHSEANLSDAGGHLGNVLEVVTADGHVSSSELSRVIASGRDVHFAMATVWQTREQVLLSPPLAARLEVQRWPELLPDEFGFPLPTDDNISEWLDAVDSWHGSFVAATARLSSAALEELLEAEASVRQAFLEGIALESAPPASSVPPNYKTLRDGTERKRQTRLDLWDRFVTADGWGPGLARLAAAGSIVGLLVFSGVSMGRSSVIVHNGLAQDVVVTVGGRSQRVPAYAHASLAFGVTHDLVIEARTDDGELIESFHPRTPTAMAQYVYSVAGASPLIRWTASYGGAVERAPVLLGNQRWFEARSDVLFEEPPESVRTDVGGASRTVLEAFDVREPSEVITALSAVEDEEDRAQMALVHGRWDPMPLAAEWLQYAGEAPEALALAQSRHREQPHVLLGRFIQDQTEGDAHDAVCEGDAERSDAAPGDADALYLKLRCLEESPERDEAVELALARFPDHGWLNVLGAHAMLYRGNVQESLARFVRARDGLETGHGMFLVMSEARARRLGDPQADLTDLVEVWPGVAGLFAHEPGQPEANPAFAALAQGDLAGAMSGAMRHGQADDVDRLARLIAVSSGATPQDQERAASLELGRGIDHSTMWSALALVRQLGRDDAEILGIIGERVADDQLETMLGFVDATRLRDNLADLEDRRLRLPLELRGHAAVLGILALGDEAPSHWRTESERLLFTHERPWLGVLAREGQESLE